MLQRRGAGVELVIPWDAPKAVIDLNSDGLLDLDMVPDSYWTVWTAAECCRVSHSTGT